jgi:hypothetical protein
MANNQAGYNPEYGTSITIFGGRLANMDSAAANILAAEIASQLGVEAVVNMPNVIEDNLVPVGENPVDEIAPFSLVIRREEGYGKLGGWRRHITRAVNGGVAMPTARDSTLQKSLSALSNYGTRTNGLETNLFAFELGYKSSDGDIALPRKAHGITFKDPQVIVRDPKILLAENIVDIGPKVAEKISQLIVAFTMGLKSPNGQSSKENT